MKLRAGDALSKVREPGMFRGVPRWHGAWLAVKEAFVRNRCVFAVLVISLLLGLSPLATDPVIQRGIDAFNTCVSNLGVGETGGRLPRRHPQPVGQNRRSAPVSCRGGASYSFEPFVSRWRLKKPQETTGPFFGPESAVSGSGGRGGEPEARPPCSARKESKTVDVSANGDAGGLAGVAGAASGDGAENLV